MMICHQRFCHFGMDDSQTRGDPHAAPLLLVDSQRGRLRGMATPYTLLYFCSWTASEFSFSMMSSFFAAEAILHDVSQSWVGVIIAAAPVAQIFGAIFIGRASAIVGSFSRLLCLSQLALAAANLLFALYFLTVAVHEPLGTPPVFVTITMALRALCGIAAGLAECSGLALLLEAVDDKGKVSARAQLFGGFGYLLGPVVGAALHTAGDHVHQGAGAVTAFTVGALPSLLLALTFHLCDAVAPTPPIQQHSRGTADMLEKSGEHDKHDGGGEGRSDGDNGGMCGVLSQAASQVAWPVALACVLLSHVLALIGLTSSVPVLQPYYEHQLDVPIADFGPLFSTAVLSFLLAAFAVSTPQLRDACACACATGDRTRDTRSWRGIATVGQAFMLIGSFFAAPSSWLSAVPPSVPLCATMTNLGAFGSALAASSTIPLASVCLDDAPATGSAHGAKRHLAVVTCSSVAASLGKVSGPILGGVLVDTMHGFRHASNALAVLFAAGLLAVAYASCALPSADAVLASTGGGEGISCPSKPEPLIAATQARSTSQEASTKSSMCANAVGAGASECTRLLHV
jgi:MFS family permease